MSGRADANSDVLSGAVENTRLHSATALAAPRAVEGPEYRVSIASSAITSAAAAHIWSVAPALAIIWRRRSHHVAITVA